MRRLFTLSALLFSSSVLLAQTTLTGSIVHDGLQRTYRLYVPASYNGATAVPLVLNLHGYTSNAVQQELYADFRPIADTANFIIVHPNGTMDATQNQYWEAFGASAIDDVGFLSALIDSLSATYSIDMNRVYSAGMSNGGFMSYALACELNHRIAAIASVTGSMVLPKLNACTMTHPTPVMQIHGTADPTVAYAGTGQTMGIEALVAAWVALNNCNTTAVHTAVPNVSVTDGCTTDHYLYADGDAGATVEFFKVNGGGHSWPGAPIDIGITSHDFSASKEIWRFFSQYKLNELVGIEERVQRIPFTVYPNPSNGSVSLQFETAADRTVQIHDMMGRLVQQLNVRSATTQFDVKGTGIFLLTIVSEKGMYTRKLQID